MNTILRRWAAAAVLAGAAPMLGACSDSPTGSGDKLSVQITASMSAPTSVFAPGESITLLQCEMVLKATATGKEGVTGTWGNATIRFFAGPDRNTPVDTFTVHGAEIRESWNAQLITAGLTQEAHWLVAAAVPFAINGDVEYTLKDGSVRKAPFAASCGPTVTPGTPAPTVSNVQMSPPGQVEAGSVVTVSYSVNAPAGLWETEVVLSGAVNATHRLRHQLQTSAVVTQDITLPGGVDLGTPVNVTVRATDGRLLTTSTHGAPFTIVDHTPPTLNSARSKTSLFGYPNELGGRFAPGDTIAITWVGFDNDRIAWLGWGIDGPTTVRDSVAPTGGETNPLRIRVRPEWVGATALRFWLTDRSGNRSPVMVSPADSFRVVPVRSSIARGLPHATPGGAMIERSPLPRVQDRVLVAGHRRTLVAVRTGGTTRIHVHTVDLH